MKARVLPVMEWDKLRPLYNSLGIPLPKPLECVIYVVEDGDKVVASWPIHSILVGGLMHVDKAHRGNGIPAMLTEAVGEHLNSGDALFTVITNPHAEKLAIANGLVEVSGKLFRKDI